MIATVAMLATGRDGISRAILFCARDAGHAGAGRFELAGRGRPGFARAKAFGPSARWFSFGAVSLILFHLQFIALGFGLLTKDNSLVFGLLTFFNIFVIIAAFCAIMGFIRLTNPR